VPKGSVTAEEILRTGGGGAAEQVGLCHLSAVPQRTGNKGRISRAAVSILSPTYLRVKNTEIQNYFKSLRKSVSCIYHQV
jgi:hypothetical protein